MGKASGWWWINRRLIQNCFPFVLYADDRTSFDKILRRCSTFSFKSQFSILPNPALSLNFPGECLLHTSWPFETDHELAWGVRG
jgi:hypothetical protein